MCTLIRNNQQKAISKPYNL